MTRPSVRAKQTLVMRMEVARRVHTSEEEDTVPLVIDAERLRAKGCAVPMMLIRMGKRLPDHDRGAIGPLPQKKAYPNTVHPLHYHTTEDGGLSKLAALVCGAKLGQRCGVIWRNLTSYLYNQIRTAGMRMCR